MTAVPNGLGPGQGGALRALLADAAYHLDQPPALGAAPLAVSERHSTAAALALRGERNGVALRIARAHAALLGEGATFLAARHRPSVYALVVRDGTVLAAILTTPAPGTTPDQLRRRLPVIPAER